MTKMISLRDEVYDRLQKQKKEGESFSDLLLRLSRPQKESIMAFAGAWKDFDEMDDIFKDILKRRSQRRRVKW